MARTRAMGNSARAESMSRGAPTTRQTVTIKTAAVSIFEGPLLKPRELQKKQRLNVKKN
jgi:hypothetical protein